jgi:hypothetical protein
MVLLETLDELEKSAALSVRAIPLEAPLRQIEPYPACRKGHKR